jgi:hypothetical protein
MTNSELESSDGCTYLLEDDRNCSRLFSDNIFRLFIIPEGDEVPG